MIIKNIAKLVKKSGRAVLWMDDARDVQWISNGSACWALFGMPLLDAENVLTALDIPEKDWEKIIVSELDEAPAAMDFGDLVDGEEQLKDPVLTLSYGGSLLLPLTTAEGLILADPDLFRPLRDVDQLTVHVRRDKEGGRYLAVKGGMLLQAIVMPKDLNTYRALPEILQTLAVGLEDSLAKLAAAPDEDEDQMAIDPETGEVIED